MSTSDVSHHVPERSLKILLLHQSWLAPELRSRGHQVTVAGYGQGVDLRLEGPGGSIDEILDFFPTANKPDCIVYHDDSRPLSILGLETVDIPTLLYAVDTHHHLSWHMYLARAFDHVWVAHLDYLTAMRAQNSTTEWMPLWAPEILKPQKTKTIEACFRGNLDPNYHPKRAKFFEEVGKFISLDAGSGHYKTDYARAKIVINQAVKNDLNFRVFEAMSAGALLITPRVLGLDSLFVDGQDLVTYEGDSVEDVCRVVKYFLAHDSERERIADSGHRKVLRWHSPSARALKLEKRLLDLKVTERRGSMLGMAVAYAHSAMVSLDISDLLSSVMVQMVVNCLFHAVKRSEEMDSTAEGLVLLAKHLLEESKKEKISLELTKRCAEAYPELEVFRAAYIDALARAGYAEQALRLVNGYAMSPEKALEVLQSEVRKAQSKMLGAYEKKR